LISISPGLIVIAKKNSNSKLWKWMTCGVYCGVLTKTALNLAPFFT
jgi:hypothetical protein